MADFGECALCRSQQLTLKARVQDSDEWECHCPRCGVFRMDGFAQAVGLTDLTERQRGALSVLSRRESEAGSKLLVTRDIDGLLEQAPETPDLSEAIDRVLLWVSDEAESYFAAVDTEPETLCAALGFHTPGDMVESLEAARSLEYLTATDQTVALTVRGWEKVGELRRNRVESRQVFVAMSFHEDLRPAWTDGFAPGIKGTQYYRPRRIDEVEHNERIDDRILAEIRRSGLVVADFTKNVRGVYLEAGFALGLGIPIIWTCHEEEIGEVHFDTRQYNHLLWAEPQDLRMKLTNRIMALFPPPGLSA